MSYVPRHARTPVYKKVLRTASASVAVTAAFISSQPAFAVTETNDKEVTTNADTTAADSGTSAADSAAADGAADNAGDTGTADVATADTPSEKDTATADEGEDIPTLAGIAPSLLGALAASGESVIDSPEVTKVVAGESVTIDTENTADSQLVAQGKVDGIRVSNAEELETHGIHVSTDGFKLVVDTDDNAPAGKHNIIFHHVGPIITEGNEGEFVSTIGIIPPEEGTDDKPEGDTETAGKDSEAYEVTYPSATTHQLGTTSISPKFATSASPVKTPQGTKFDLTLTRDGKPLATAGGETTPQWLSIDSTTGAITVHPEYNTAPGEYTGEVTVTYPDGSVDKAPVSFTITASKDADKYTPKYGLGHLNPAATQDSEMNLTVEESRPLPEGTTFALVKDEPGVSVDKNGRVTLHARDNAKPGRYLAKVKVTYPDGTSDVVSANYRIDDKDTQAETTDISDAHTTKDDALRMKRRTTAVLPALAAVAGQTLPEGTKFAPGTAFPKWATLSEDTGEIKLNPTLNDHPGDYAIDTIVVYPDGSRERVTRYVHVESGYSTGEWFQYKRKDGLGKKVGRAIDKALGTELDHSDSEDPQTASATSTDDDNFGLIGTAVKPSEAAATGTAPDATGRSANAPRQAAATGTAGTTTRTERLATTGTDTDLYVTAGAVASSFALAAAGAFALRRRREA